MMFMVIVVISTITGDHKFQARRAFDTAQECREYAEDVEMVLKDSKYVTSVKARCHVSDR